MRLDVLLTHKRNNQLQTALMLAGISGTLALVGWSFGGLPLMFGLLAAGGLIVWLTPKLAPAVVLRMYKAVPLGLSNAPGLIAVVEELAARAGLEQVPKLYYVPSAVLNAFAVGDRDHAAIAVTDGLLRSLDDRELTGVLAHEMTHIRNNDLQVMALADALSRLTHSFSLVGQLMVLINLPILLAGGQTISWVGMLLLVFAPQITALMQLGLSRAREYDADLGAVELTGDPRGLASALSKLEYHSAGLFERVFMPGRRNPDPSLLRTHPRTEDRIARLLALESRPAVAARRAYLAEDEPLDLEELVRVLGGAPPRPRRHFNGLWY